MVLLVVTRLQREVFLFFAPVKLLRFVMGSVLLARFGLSESERRR